MLAAARSARDLFCEGTCTLHNTSTAAVRNEPAMERQRPACVAGSSEAGLLVRLSKLLAEDGPAQDEP